MLLLQSIIYNSIFWALGGEIGTSSFTATWRGWDDWFSSSWWNFCWRPIQKLHEAGKTTTTFWMIFFAWVFWFQCHWWFSLTTCLCMCCIVILSIDSAASFYGGLSCCLAFLPRISMILVRYVKWPHHLCQGHSHCVDWSARIRRV